MKKFLLFVLFLCPIVSMAQEQTKIDSTMTFRISEIEVYPEYLKEYLELSASIPCSSSATTVRFAFLKSMLRRKRISSTSRRSISRPTSKERSTW